MSAPLRDMSEEELAELRAKLATLANGKPRLLTPLPRRTRARLAVEHAVNSAGIWLVNHGHVRAAGLLWAMPRTLRLCGYAAIAAAVIITGVWMAWAGVPQ